MVNFAELMAKSQSNTQAANRAAEEAQKQREAKLAEEKKKRVERELRDAEIARQARERHFEEQKKEKEREERRAREEEEREKRREEEQQRERTKIRVPVSALKKSRASSSRSTPSNRQPRRPSQSDSEDDQLAKGATALTRDEIKARRLHAQKVREFGASASKSKMAAARGPVHGQKLKGGAYNIVQDSKEGVANGPGNIKDRALKNAGKLFSIAKVDGGKRTEIAQPKPLSVAKLSGMKSTPPSSSTPSPRPGSAASNKAQSRTYAVPSFASKPKHNRPPIPSAGPANAKKRPRSDSYSDETPSPPASKRSRPAGSGFQDEIWRIMGKDRSRYQEDIFSDEDEESDMEAGAGDLEDEEMESMRWAKREDKMAEEEEKRHMEEKRRRKEALAAGRA